MRWFLHGAVGMAGDWDVLGEGGDDRQVDLWSSLEDEGLTMDDFARRIGAEAAGSDPAPVLVGYSMGGRLALHCLLAHPGLWKAAVIVSAHPGLQDERSRLERMADDAEWAGKALTADWGKFLEEWEGQEIFTPSKGALSWPARAKLEPRREAVARSFMEWSLGKQDDLRTRLGEISCPVLWVTGQRDEKFSALAADSAPLLPMGRHAIVENAGHRVPWEAPGPFRALIDDFLPPRAS